jgi:hypothetical protein
MIAFLLLCILCVLIGSWWPLVVLVLLWVLTTIIED